jgi:hypothetical protein
MANPQVKSATRAIEILEYFKLGAAAALDVSDGE